MCGYGILLILENAIIYTVNTNQQFVRTKYTQRGDEMQFVLTKPVYVHVLLYILSGSVANCSDIHYMLFIEDILVEFLVISGHFCNTG